MDFPVAVDSEGESGFGDLVHHGISKLNNVLLFRLFAGLIRENGTDDSRLAGAEYVVSRNTNKITNFKPRHTWQTVTCLCYKVSIL
jgi:hypothetical protein